MSVGESKDVNKINRAIDGGNMVGGELRIKNEGNGSIIISGIAYLSNNPWLVFRAQADIN